MVWLTSARASFRARRVTPNLSMVEWSSTSTTMLTLSRLFQRSLPATERKDIMAESLTLEQSQYQMYSGTSDGLSLRHKCSGKSQSVVHNTNLSLPKCGFIIYPWHETTPLIRTLELVLTWGHPSSQDTWTSPKIVGITWLEAKGFHYYYSVTSLKGQ